MTDLLESTINQMVSQRDIEHESIRWSERRQTCFHNSTHVLDDELRRIFSRWYSGMENAGNQL